MLKFVLAVFFVFSSMPATAGLTSPTGDQIAGGTAVFEWTDDAPEFWLRVYDDGDIIYDSGRQLSNESQTVLMPEDDSTISAVFYRKIGGVWSSTTSEWISVRGMDPEPPPLSIPDVIHVVVDRSTLYVEEAVLPAVGYLDWTAELIADCPSGYKVTGHNAVLFAWKSPEILEEIRFAPFSSFFVKTLPAVVKENSVSTWANGVSVPSSIELLPYTDENAEYWNLKQELTAICINQLQ